MFASLYGQLCSCDIFYQYYYYTFPILLSNLLNLLFLNLGSHFFPYVILPQ